MFNHAEGHVERRKTGERQRMLGRVIACNGARATISAIALHGDTSLSQMWSVGRLITINVNDNRVVALVASMHTDNRVWGEDSDNVVIVEAELLGEVTRDA